MALNRLELAEQASAAATTLFREKGYISIIDVLMAMGKVSKQDYEEWRFGRVPYLEKVIGMNLAKINVVMRTIQRNSERGGLKPSKTVYRLWGKGPKKLLRFSKSGDPNIEAAYSTSFVKANKSILSPPKRSISVS